MRSLIPLFAQGQGGTCSMAIINDARSAQELIYLGVEAVMHSLDLPKN